MGVVTTILVAGAGLSFYFGFRLLGIAGLILLAVKLIKG